MTKRIFITGASSGLGKATAILFAKKGWNVIATMRNPEKDNELGNYEQIDKLPLDVTNLEQIKSTVKKAISIGDIDAVFNNAGYGLAGPFEGATDEQITRQIETNLLGVMRVTKEFISYFRKRNYGIFVTTTSIGGLITFPFNSVYHATKWALEGWSESLAFELEPFGIKVKTVSPGGIKTDFAGRSLDMSRHEAYDDMVNKVISVFSDPERQKHSSSPEQIAEVVYEAVTDGKDQLRYVAGKDAKMMYAQRMRLGDETFRKEIKNSFLK